MGWSEETNGDPQVISIGPWLTPRLVTEALPGDAKVIPIRPDLLARSEERHRVPWRHLWLAGFCWMIVVLL